MKNKLLLIALLIPTSCAASVAKWFRETDEDYCKKMVELYLEATNNPRHNPESICTYLKNKQPETPLITKTNRLVTGALLTISKGNESFYITEEKIQSCQGEVEKAIANRIIGDSISPEIFCRKMAETIAGSRTNHFVNKKLRTKNVDEKWSLENVQNMLNNAPRETIGVEYAKEVNKALKPI